jgi:CDP-2,3-bis-(O-geranylgeranyl)-sn-glycerol synthase
MLNAVNSSVESIIGIKLPQFSHSSLVGLSVGAIVGDAAGSFLKRRIGVKRGQFLPIVDQLDFLIGAILITSLIATNWSSIHLVPEKLIFLLIGTPFLHIGVNKLDDKLEIT